MTRSTFHQLSLVLTAVLSVFVAPGANAIRLPTVHRIADLLSTTGHRQAAHLSDVTSAHAPLPVDGANTCNPLGKGGSGEYTYVNHGKPQKPVVSKARVTITPGNCGQGTKTNQFTQQYAQGLGNPSDDAGHIIAHALGGDGTNPINIFPQSPTINRGVYREFEASIYQCLCPNTNATLSESAAKSADLTWAFKYASTKATRPNQITYSASFTGGTCKNLKQTFDN